MEDDGRHQALAVEGDGLSGVTVGGGDHLRMPRLIGFAQAPQNVHGVGYRSG